MIQPDAIGRGRRASDGILCVGYNVDGSSNGWDTDVSICICDKTLLGDSGIYGNGVDGATCGCEEHGSFAVDWIVWSKAEKIMSVADVVVMLMVEPSKINTYTWKCTIYIVMGMKENIQNIYIDYQIIIRKCNIKSLHCIL